MIAKADKTLSGKEHAAIEQYTHPGSETKGNWCQSYLLGGYAKCKGWETNAIRVLQKDYIQAAIIAKRASITQELGMTVDRMHKQYDEDRAFAHANKQPSAMVSASVATARLYGMDKDAGRTDQGLTINIGSQRKVINSKTLGESNEDM